MGLRIFESLTDDQFLQLKEALPLITVLVAGADGHIDEQELNWADKLTTIRSYAKPEELNAFYAEVEGTLESRIHHLIENLPKDISSREEIISGRLSSLNKIFQCLDNSIAYQLYTSFTSFARHIAKASGGFLRFGSISGKEKQWIDLPMIEPIILEITDEEE